MFTDWQILALRKENEPNYHLVCEEHALMTREIKYEHNNFPIDFKLIQRVMFNERRRELERSWNGPLGRRAKQQNLSTTGKNPKHASAADSITDISK